MDDKVKSWRDVVELGVKMRAAQKAYFTQGRTRDQLDASKKLEREFDQAAKAVLADDLFR